MSRNKNSKDKKKRKRKILIDSILSRNIANDYSSGLTYSQLNKKYGVSKGAINNILRDREIKPRLIHNDISLFKRIDLGEIQKDVCGIYGILFVNKENVNNFKLYIGSSVNIKNRLLDHLRHLKK